MGTRDDHFPGELPSIPQVIDLRGRLTLAETAWVLKSANLAIGNDCGPMHIADVVQTPSIVIFGPTCDLKNSPRYKTVPITVDLYCRPCEYLGPISCPDPKCMTKLNPDLVMEKIETLAQEQNHSFRLDCDRKLKAE